MYLMGGIRNILIYLILNADVVIRTTHGWGGGVWVRKIWSIWFVTTPIMGHCARAVKVKNIICFEYGICANDFVRNIDKIYTFIAVNKIIYALQTYNVKKFSLHDVQCMSQ